MSHLWLCQCWRSNGTHTTRCPHWWTEEEWARQQRVSLGNEHPDTIALRECQQKLKEANATCVSISEYWQFQKKHADECRQQAESERDTARAALEELHKHWSEMSDDAGRYFKRVEASEAGLATLQAKVARAVALWDASLKARGAAYQIAEAEFYEALEALR